MTLNSWCRLPLTRNYSSPAGVALSKSKSTAMSPQLPASVYGSLVPGCYTRSLCCSAHKTKSSRILETQYLRTRREKREWKSFTPRLSSGSTTTKICNDTSWQWTNRWSKRESRALTIQVKQYKYINQLPKQSTVNIIIIVVIVSSSSSIVIYLKFLCYVIT